MLILSSVSSQADANDFCKLLYYSERKCRRQVCQIARHRHGKSMGLFLLMPLYSSFYFMQNILFYLSSIFSDSSRFVLPSGEDNGPKDHAFGLIILYNTAQ
jgi:hypothetical protein